MSGELCRPVRPHRLRTPTPDATLRRVEALRRQRWTGRQIAREFGLRHIRTKPYTPKTNGPSAGSG